MCDVLDSLSAAVRASPLPAPHISALTATHRVLPQPQMCISIAHLLALEFRVAGTHFTSTLSTPLQIFTIQVTQFLASRPFHET